MASVVTIDSGSVCWLVQVDSSQRVFALAGISAWPPWRPRSYRYARAISAEQIAGMTHVRRSPGRIGERTGARGDCLAPAESVMRDEVHP